MRDDPTLVALVLAARDGSQTAWDQLVERYAPLVYGICRRHGLAGMDVDDVGASVWLRLVERLDTIREPAALPGWIATTTRNECLRALRARQRTIPAEPDERLAADDPPFDDWLVAQERGIALRAAFAGLPDRCRRLLSLLFADPPTPYSEISAAIGIAVGAIGPNRQRCLDRLRRDPALASLLDGTEVAR
ncbi:sigma-70 family RNA polymerase sigma factor [Dactylosporangium sp. NPDC005572]|uniref:RNA polymerase sigma factor n=1 Tax=Dactylosporangium sp. NPDC005572 TaxID=3156889 RepID=UPI00339DC958